MFAPSDIVTTGLGKHMKTFFVRIALAAAVLLPAPTVLAADLDAPPPVADLRPATYDWSGPYAGAFLGGLSVNGSYNTTCVLCGIYERSNSGWSTNAGVMAGWNTQWDSLVMGVEGDWAWGGTVAKDTHPTEMTKLKFSNMGSLRARLGWALDDTLIYGTGGLAFVDTTFSSSDYPTGTGGAVKDGAWVKGWVLGGGVEHAFSDRLSGRLEYTYTKLADTDYTFDDGAGNVTPFTHTFDGVHAIRLGMSYNFGW
jgi:outer membrane immunogenic protein